MRESRAEELARLVEQQRRDDATDRAYINRAIRESEMRRPDGGAWSLDSVADSRAIPAEVRAEWSEGSAFERAISAGLVGVNLVWTAEVVGYAGGEDCPACEGLELRGRATCLVCSTSADQPKRHSMRGTPTRAARPRRSKGGKVLAGGTGGKPKAPPKRARRAPHWEHYLAPAW